MDKSRKKEIKNLCVLGIIIVFLICAILIVVQSEFKISLKKEIVINNNPSAQVTDFGKINPSSLNQLKKDRINFLFLGIAGEGNSAPQLTDTILIINSSPKGESPVAISIPRDLLVKYPEKNYYTKINALYKYGGIETIKTKIKEITDLNIDYYLVLDLKGVKQIIDKLDGVDIDIKEDIYDPKFPAEYNSYETFSLKQGIQHLDGTTALKYIRTRNQSGGDFSRIEHQQQVISAIKDKVLKLNILWNFPTVLGLWNNIKQNAETNVGLIDIKYVLKLIKKTDLSKIQFNTIAPPLVVSDTRILGGETASVVIPKNGKEKYDEIKNYINNLFINL
jgi:polyisoprenyl-teichoic acid--peptidoglycan teichoic acid transferase